MPLTYWSRLLQLFTMLLILKLVHLISSPTFFVNTLAVLITPTKKLLPFALLSVLLSSATNLTDLGFCDNCGRPITSLITVDPATRIPGISYFVFRSTIDPTTVHSRIMRASITIEFWLALPQPILATELATDHALAIFSSDLTAPLPLFPKLLQPLPCVKLI